LNSYMLNVVLLVVCGIFYIFFESIIFQKIKGKKCS
jgi:hypothetical protein